MISSITRLTASRMEDITKKNPFLELAHCKACNNPFIRRTRRGSTRSKGVQIKRKNAKTCSRECARLYVRIRDLNYHKQKRFERNYSEESPPRLCSLCDKILNRDNRSGHCAKHTRIKCLCGNMMGDRSKRCIECRRKGKYNSPGRNPSFKRDLRMKTTTYES